MFPSFGVAAFTLITIIIYLVVGIFALVMAWRFVKAAESIAESMEKLVESKR